MVITILKIICAIVGIALFITQIRDFKNREEAENPRKTMLTHLCVGSVVQFFDTLGIGSFPVLSTIYRNFKLVPDELIPATLSIGTVVPCAYEGFCFLTSVQVDVKTLTVLLSMSVVGALVGSTVRKHTEIRNLRLIMGVLMGIAAVVMLMGQLGVMPAGGNASGLSGVKLIIGAVCVFALSFGTSFGGTMYGPMMCVIYMLGMNPLCAFPIMMCSATFACATNGFHYIPMGNYHRRAAMGTSLGAFIGCTIGLFFVTSIPLNALKWVVLVVVIYTAFTLLRDGLGDRKSVAADKTSITTKAI